MIADGHGVGNIKVIKQVGITKANVRVALPDFLLTPQEAYPVETLRSALSDRYSGVWTKDIVNDSKFICFSTIPT